MANARDVKNRIKSVKNISQITRALEAVSASRVRRAQERANASRDYAEKAWEILLNVQAATVGTLPHPLLQSREEVNAYLVVVITSDRGLAGAFNTNILRVANRFEQRADAPVKYVAIGRKGRDSLIRQGKDLIAEFSDLPANPSISDIRPIVQVCINAFLDGEVDEVLIAYTDFINMLTQRPVALSWLPLTPHGHGEMVVQEYAKDKPQVTEDASDYEYEPNTAAVLDEIVPRFSELQLYQAILESQASEHAARMNAMRNATDNASQLVDDLTLEYNKARQAAITSEILDIVGGANALADATAEKGPKQRKSARELFATLGQQNGSNGNGAAAAGVNAVVAEETPVEEAVAPSAPDIVEQPEPTEDMDDLARIEGIGPRITAALRDANFDTFVKVRDASEAELRAAIEVAGIKFAPSLPTWSQQAGLAADGRWDELDVLQQNLTAGRPQEADDLLRLEGVGPKVSQALIEAGFDTYRKIADASEDELRQAIEVAGMRLAPSLNTWSEQAEYAARGDWDGLQQFQNTLVAGRRVDDGDA